MDKLEVKLQGVDGLLDTLKKLPPELVKKRGGPLRAALRKGARVLVLEARKNFRAAVAQPGVSGVTETTGFTAKHIVSKRRRMYDGQPGERFVVAVDSKPHPSAKKMKRKGRKKSSGVIKTNDIAFIMEYGSKNQPAIPWMRQAFLSKAEEAIRVVESEAIKGVEKLAAQVAAQQNWKK